MKNACCLVFILSLYISVKAQDNYHQDSIAVTQVIQHMFTAMKTSDTKFIKNMF